MPDGDRKSQYAKALAELRALAMTGELPAGQRLSEVALAERLGISRTPLRAAMSRLVHEGLMSELPNGGCCLQSLSMDDVRDAIEFRGTLEGTALRLSAERGTGRTQIAACEDLALELDQVLSDGASRIDFDRYSEVNEAFHEALIDMCPSRILRREVRRAAHLPLAGPSAFVKGQSDIDQIRASLYVAQAQHRAMIEAVRDGEGTRAEALGREHARLARQNLEYVMHGDPALKQRIPGIALVAT